VTLRPAVIALPLAALLLVPASRAAADVAATGMFDITLSLTPPNVPFSGTISFDEGERTALGATVDLATDVGEMTFEGDAVVDVSAESATFTLGAESDVDFDFAAAGAGSCENSGCINGRGTFAGRFTTLNDPDGALPDGVYTFDGTAEINFGQGPGGVFAINAFPVTATPAGAAVEVSSGPQTFHDTIANAVRSFLASARFETVGVAGGTQFVAFSALPGAFPPGVFQNGMISVFVDVSTSAMVAGGVQLCLGYPDADHDGIVDGTVNNISETRLRLLNAASVGAAFSDVTSSVGNERVCGNVSAVGPMVIGVVPVGATTTTSIPGASTTTSSTLVTTTSTTPTSSSSTTTSTAAPPANTTTTIADGPGTSTTTTTLPVCATALECLEVAIAGPLCPDEAINAKLSKFMLKKLTKTQAALLGTQSTSSAKRIIKLVAKARRQLDKIGAKANAFVAKRKGAISAGCRDQIRAATGRVTQRIEANRI